MKKKMLVIILMVGSACFSMEEKSKIVNEPIDPLAICKKIKELCTQNNYDEALSWYARGLLRVELDWAYVENKKVCNVPKLFAQQVNQLDSSFLAYQKEQTDATRRNKSIEALTWLEKKVDDEGTADCSWIFRFAQQVGNAKEELVVSEQTHSTLKKQLLEFRQQLESVEKTPPLRRATN